MPFSVFVDIPDLFPHSGSGLLQVALTYALIACGSMAVLFSLIFVGSRAVRPHSVRRRARAGIVAAVVVIALATLDVYLTLSAV